ncbi:Uncharacterised protein [Budvicia aquatica]|nr:Uncharacterised protein [Budvicia aquatica]
MSSPLSPALNPSFDEQMIQESMPAPEVIEEPEIDAAEAEVTESEPDIILQPDEPEHQVIVIREPGENKPGSQDDDDDEGSLEKAYTMV